MNYSFLSGCRISAILKKEFIQLWRDKTTLRMIVTIPIMQLLLFGFAINSNPKHLPTSVISEDNNIISRNIVTSLKNSNYFQINDEISSEKEADLLLQQGRIIFSIIIPKDFARNLVRNTKPYLIIEVDGTDPIAVGGAMGAIENIIRNAIRRDSKGVIGYSSILPDSTYEIRIHNKYNPEGLSRYNVVPGLIGIVLTMTGVMMTALSLTRERERGTMENLLSMPVKPIEVMIGKIAPYIIIGYIQSAIIIITARFLFGVPILGSLPLLAFGLFIFIVCNLAMGFTFSAGAKNQMQAMQMSVFILLPSILLSGFMFPFLGMPKWAQIIGYIIPSTYFIRIVRGIMLKGSTFIEIWPNIWPLLIFMSAITLMSIKVYKKTLD